MIIHRPTSQLLSRAVSRPTGSPAMALWGRRQGQQQRALSSHAEEGRSKGQHTAGGTGGPRAAWYQPWLSDKSLYPVMAISVATVAFALWFGPAWIYSTPTTRVEKDRRQSVVYDKKEHEAVPMRPDMYTLSRKLTKEVIYPATLGASAGTDDAMAAKEEQHNKSSRQSEDKTGGGDAGTTGSSHGHSK